MDAALSTEGLLSWLDFMGYPLPLPHQPVLVMFEGLLPLLAAGQGQRWRDEHPDCPGAVGDLWEADQPGASLPVRVVPDAVDEHNETGVLCWIAADTRAPRIAAFLGSANSGSVYGRRSGWAQLGDGMHLYLQDKNNRTGQPAFRSPHNGNRCLREEPPRPGVGGDGEVDLTEVVSRGMVYNPSVLGHPGRKATASGACWLTSGRYASPSWQACWGLTGPSGQLWVGLHEGSDFAAYLASGGRQYVPMMRPGCNARSWMAPVQAALGVRPDGYFGPATAKALLAWRRGRPGLSEAQIRDRRLTEADWLALGVTPRAA